VASDRAKLTCCVFRPPRINMFVGLRAPTAATTLRKIDSELGVIEYPRGRKLRPARVQSDSLPRAAVIHKRQRVIHDDRNNIARLRHIFDRSPLPRRHAANNGGFAYYYDINVPRLQRRKFQSTCRYLSQQLFTCNLFGSPTRPYKRLAREIFESFCIAGQQSSMKIRVSSVDLFDRL
jgi:hypothetical protein